MFNRIISKLKFLGLELEQTELYIIDMELENSKKYILNFCNIDSIFNEDLENILIEMTAYNIFKFKNNQNNEDKEIKSINEGDISITYETTNNSKNTYINKYLKNLDKRLLKYRRIEW